MDEQAPEHRRARPATPLIAAAPTAVIDADHSWWAVTSAALSTNNGLAMTSDRGAHWRMVNPPHPE
jgi:hypothetical protein